MIFLFPRWDMLVPWRVYRDYFIRHEFRIPNPNHSAFHGSCQGSTLTLLMSSRLAISCLCPALLWNCREAQVGFQRTLGGCVRLVSPWFCLNRNGQHIFRYGYSRDCNRFIKYIYINLYVLFTVCTFDNASPMSCFSFLKPNIWNLEMVLGKRTWHAFPNSPVTKTPFYSVRTQTNEPAGDHWGTTFRPAHIGDCQIVLLIIRLLLELLEDVYEFMLTIFVLQKLP